MIVFDPIIDIGVIVLIGVLMVAMTVYTYAKVGGRLSIPKKCFLMTSRLLATIILLIILLQPSYQKNDELKKDNLRIGIMLDTSKSMNQNDIEGAKRLEKALVLSLEEVKSGSIPIEFYGFDTTVQSLSSGELVGLQAKGNSTRFHDSLKDLFSRQANYGMKAVVMFTDGHDFQGEDIRATAQKVMSHHAKLYAVPIGNAGKVRDLDLSLTVSQDYIFKDNMLELTAVLRARSCQFEAVNLELFKNGQLIDNKQFNLGDKVHHEIRFSLKEANSGISEYEVKVTRLDAEADFKNNQSTVFVNVVDQQIRTLLLEGQPHWETTFLRRFLNKNKVIELDSFTQYRPGSISTQTAQPGRELPTTYEEFKKYDIILIGRQIDQLLSASAVEELRKYVFEGGSVIFVRGNAFQSEIGKSMQPVEWDEAGIDQVTLKSSSEGKRLSLFKKLNEKSDNKLTNDIPVLPLSRHVAQKKPLAQFLALAEDENNDTQAVVYRRFGKGQTMSYGVEGLWHWRFNKNYTSENDYYAALWDQSILWIIHNSEFIPGSIYSFRQDVSQLELGDSVNFTFSVRQEDKIPTTEIKAQITSTFNGRKYVVTLNQDPQVPHRFKSSFTPPEEGSYVVELVDPDGKKHELKFVSFQNSPEEKEVNVDIDYLRELCEKTGGRLLEPKELGSLDKLLGETREEGAQMRTKVIPVWDKVWLMYFICFFLGLDWFFRRKWGLS